MRKSIFYALCLSMSVLFGVGQANAQCTVNTTTCTNATIYGKICPGTLPVDTAGTAYSATNSFQIPNSFQLNTASLGLSFGTITVNVLKVTATITGLPRGLTAAFDNGTGVYTPASATSSGCFQISGTACDTAGTYPTALNISVRVSIAGLITLDLPFPLVTPVPLTVHSIYPRLVLTEPYKHLCLTGAGSSVTVNATPGFGSYLWSDASTLDSLNVTTAGFYKLTVTTTDNACTFNDSINIDSVKAHITSDTSICRGSFLALHATGGDTYVWSPSTYLSATNIANPVVLRTDTAGLVKYQVTVSNGFCADSAIVSVSTHICSSASTCDTCAVIPSGCTGTVPKLCASFPAVTAGVPYSQSVTFYLPASIAISALLPIPITIPGLPTSFALDNAKIVVDSLPVGLDWATDQSGNGNKYVPNLDPSFQYGCLKICGTTCGPVASNYMKVSAKVELPAQLKAIVKSLKSGPAAALLGNIDTIIAVPLTGSLSVVAAAPLTITPAGTVTIHQGDSVTLHCNTSNLYTSYSWASGSTSDSLVVDTAGTFCATVTDTAHCTQTACKTVTLLQGVDNIALASTFNIYPNPNTGAFNVQFTLKNSVSVTTEVFDVTGKAIYSYTFTGSAGTNKLPIDMNGVAKGIYVVKLTTAEGTVNRKVTIK